jgi:hypothetical protein
MTSYTSSEHGGNGGWLVDTVTRNPEGVLLLAAGCALLMRNGSRSVFSRQSGPSSHTTDPGYGSYRSTSGIGDRVSEAGRRASNYVSDVTDKVSEAARSYASSVSDYADEVSSVATEQSERLVNQARDTADYIVRDQPWAVALAGVLAGVAVAAVFPTSSVERRTLGQVGQRLRSSAEDLGERVVDAGTQAAKRVGEIAEERGLTTEGLKDAAREVGDTFNSALAGREQGSAQGHHLRGESRTGSSRQQSSRGQSGAQTTGAPQSSSSGPSAPERETSESGDSTSTSRNKSSGPRDTGPAGAGK